MKQIHDTHTRTYESHAEAWNRKPLLKKIYTDFYRSIANELQHEHKGLIVEIGSGVPNATDVIPGALRTDSFAHGSVNQVENIYALSFETGSVANLFMVDVFHHLEFPGSALDECYRVFDSCTS